MSARDRREARTRESRSAQRTAEQHAFAQGKRAGERRLATHANPYRAPDLREAWARGHRLGIATADGLRPLDTARRKP